MNKELQQNIRKLIDQRELDNALILVTDYISENKDDIQAYLLRAEILENINKIEDAIDDYNKILEIQALFSDLARNKIKKLSNITNKPQNESNSAKQFGAENLKNYILWAIIIVLAIYCLLYANNNFNI